MNTQREIFQFTVPLTADNHQIAQGFHQYHTDPKKAKQVYLNTLSIQVVNFYLNCLGFETEFEKSQSWNPALQILADTADLWVTELGRLECRPVLPDVTDCTVPSQVWGDRIGYIFVQLNPELTEATILGFVPTINREILPIEALQSLDEFPDYLSQLSTYTSNNISTVLSQWLNNIVDAGWQSIETLMAEIQEQQIAFSFRNSVSEIATIEPIENGMKHGKFIALNEASEDRMLFLIGISPAQIESEFNITVELYPVGDRDYLPKSLQIAVLDEMSNAVLQAEGSNSEGLEFQFSGEIGECFDIKVSLNEFSFTETFQI